MSGAVHPRGCGEQGRRSGGRASARGSSPRVRGTVARNTRLDDGARFIPAGAGNSRIGVIVQRSPAVHPRGCGEQARALLFGRSVSGSSPRVRGTALERTAPSQLKRFIPAGAGNSPRPPPRPRRPAVHPRGCGEQIMRRSSPRSTIGSSPRVRGTDRTPALPAGRRRFIPAGAGNRPPTGS